MRLGFLNIYERGEEKKNGWWRGAFAASPSVNAGRSFQEADLKPQVGIPRSSSRISAPAVGSSRVVYRADATHVAIQFCP